MRSRYYRPIPRRGEQEISSWTERRRCLRPSCSPARRKCEAVLSATFERHAGKDAYVLLRSEQLVGTAIFVYVKADLLSSITRVEGASRKASAACRTGSVATCGLSYWRIDRLARNVREQGWLRYSPGSTRYTFMSHDVSFGGRPHQCRRT